MFILCKLKSLQDPQSSSNQGGVRSSILSLSKKVMFYSRSGHKAPRNCQTSNSNQSESQGEKSQLSQIQPNSLLHENNMLEVSISRPASLFIHESDDQNQDVLSSHLETAHAKTPTLTNSTCANNSSEDSFIRNELSPPPSQRNSVVQVCGGDANNPQGSTAGGCDVNVWPILSAKEEKKTGSLVPGKDGNFMDTSDKFKDFKI